MQVQPSQVSPGESFDVFYFLRNHTDATSYYVQAKIHDVRTGELLKTLSLSQSATNSRLFIATTEAPGDPAGYGRNIVSIATVYSDAGLTTKSENYEEQEQYFLVKALPLMGGGAVVDYGVIRDMVHDELSKALSSPIKAQVDGLPKETDLSFVDSINRSLGAITREIGRIPKTPSDFSGLQKSLDQLQADISALLERPTFKETDLSSLAELGQEVLSGLRELEDDGKVRDAQLVQTLQSTLEKFKAETTTAIVAGVEETIQGQEITLPVAMKVTRPKKEVAPEADPIAGVRHLMK